ncbi:IS3 family transposase [Fructobacillus evanidus]
MAELKAPIENWIHYCNTERFRTKLKVQSPIEYRRLAS